MEYEIRPMTYADLDDVASIEAATFSEPWTKKDFEDALENPFYLYYVATVEGNVIATAGLIITIDEATVTNVAVLGEYRKNGVAYRLLRELMAAGHEVGVESFTLEVRSGNAPAIGLYEKLGFVNEGIRPGFYDKPKEDALIYWKRR